MGAINRERVELAGALRQIKSLIRAPAAEKPPRKSGLSIRIIWVQCQRTLVFRFSFSPVPLPNLHIGQERVRSRKIWVKFHGFLRRYDFLLEVRVRPFADKSRAEIVVGRRQPKVSRSECCILAYGVLEMTNTFLDIRLCRTLVQIIGTLKVAFVNFRSNRLGGGKTLPPVSRHRHFHFLRDGLRHVALKRKDVS